MVEGTRINSISFYCFQFNATFNTNQALYKMLPFLSFVMVPRPFTSVQALGSQTCTDVIQPSGMTGVWNESLVISALPYFCKRESLMFTDFLFLHPIRQTFQRV